MTPEACPFCGDDPVLEHDGYMHAVYCPSCYDGAPDSETRGHYATGRTPADAAESWWDIVVRDECVELDVASYGWPSPRRSSATPATCCARIQKIRPNRKNGLAPHTPLTYKIDMDTTTTVSPPETSDDDALQPVQNHDGWGVEDPRAGGVWYPDDDADAEIEAADDPALAVLEMCKRSPMRGAWHW